MKANEYNEDKRTDDERWWDANGKPYTDIEQSLLSAAKDGNGDTILRIGGCLYQLGILFNNIMNAGKWVNVDDENKH